MSGKKIAHLGMLTALAFIFSYVENLMPISIGVPGMKLGLANLVIVVALYTLGAKDALGLSIVRMILVAFSFSNLSALLYSLAGGLLSLLAMAAAKKTGMLSVAGVSVLGGVCHNIGQILMALAMLGSVYVFSYLPVLLLSGIVSGIVIGILAAIVTKRVGKLLGQEYR